MPTTSISTWPPPATRREIEHRAGYVWVPGVWQWNNGKHEWAAGHLVAERKGYRYAPDRWVRHDNDKWAFQRGGWNRDSDGDGTPDRLDRQPNNLKISGTRAPFAIVLKLGIPSNIQGASW